MSSSITITVRNSGNGVIKVTPSFAIGTYFALDADFQTGEAEILGGRSVEYVVYFKGSEITGTYTDNLILTNNKGENIYYQLKATVVDNIPNFHGDPVFGSTVDFGKVLSRADTIEVDSGSGWSQIPLWDFYYAIRLQSIYLSSDINFSGKIKSLYLKIHPDYPPSNELTDWTIRIKQTTLSEYPISTEAIWEGTGWTTVYTSDESILSTGWYEFIFDTPFEYDGIDNLMIDFSFNRSSISGSNGYIARTDTSSRRSIYRSDNYTESGPLIWSGTTPSKSTSNDVPSIKLYIEDLNKSNTSEIIIYNDTKNTINISAPSLSTGTYFTIDTDFQTAETSLISGDDITYGVYFNGSLVYDQTYNDILTLKNGYGDDITYYLSANTIRVPNLLAYPVSGSVFDFGDINQGDESIHSTSIVLTNNGDSGSVLNLNGATFSGTDAALFDFVTPFVNPTELIGSTGNTSCSIKFLGESVVGSYTATLTFTSDNGDIIYYDIIADVIGSDPCSCDSDNWSYSTRFKISGWTNDFFDLSSCLFGPLVPVSEVLGAGWSIWDGSFTDVSESCIAKVAGIPFCQDSSTGDYAGVYESLGDGLVNRLYYDGGTGKYVLKIMGIDYNSLTATIWEGSTDCGPTGTYTQSSGCSTNHPTITIDTIP